MLKYPAMIVLIFLFKDKQGDIGKIIGLFFFIFFNEFFYLVSFVLRVTEFWDSIDLFSLCFSHVSTCDCSSHVWQPRTFIFYYKYRLDHLFSFYKIQPWKTGTRTQMTAEGEAYEIWLHIRVKKQSSFVARVILCK